MYCRLFCASIVGIEAVPVTVEADASNGMPMFEVVGYVSVQVREAQARVRAALRSCGISIPPKRITVNLSPGDIRKEGTRFDLPIAAALLGTIGIIDPRVLENVMLMGELHLDGTVGKISGVLSSVLCAQKTGTQACIVPFENKKEAEIVRSIPIIGIRSLEELIAYCKTGMPPDAEEKKENAKEIPARQPDFSDIRGQSVLKRCSLIAAAGFHNLLFTGPPGSGKSMAARRLATILPPLSEKEKLEISRIYSIAGLLPEDHPLITERPFRAPHHSVTAAALMGGGKYPVPGEVTLSHRGVLFLDEMPEMKRDTLEMLRQPLEDRRVRITRLNGSCLFPASFLLVAAMNPCPCGFYPDRQRCVCGAGEIHAYQSRVSRALLDRIDLQCALLPVAYEELAGKKEESVTSAELRDRVSDAAAIQRDRFCGTNIRFNSEIEAADMDRYCTVTKGAEQLLRAAFDRLSLSARGYHHVLRVARTIADLDHEENIREEHISEAIGYRVKME
jgi:magnesium chelatase family protein